jgi:ribosome-binding factor A
MSKSNRRRAHERASEGEIFIEDQLSEASRRVASNTDYKTDALCTQVRRVLDYVVGGELRDEALRDLVVMDVSPAGSCRRMRVVIRTVGDVDCAVVLERLEAARGFLRVQIAEAIHRKRTPELVFEVLPPVESGGERWAQ